VTDGSDSDDLSSGDECADGEFAGFEAGSDVDNGDLRVEGLSDDESAKAGFDEGLVVKWGSLGCGGGADEAEFVLDEVDAGAVENSRADIEDVTGAERCGGECKGDGTEADVSGLGKGE